MDSLCPVSGHYTDQVVLMKCMGRSRAKRQLDIHQLAYATMGIWLVQTILPSQSGLQDYLSSQICSAPLTTSIFCHISNTKRG